MSSEYAGKSDSQIIQEQASSLNAKSNNQDPTEKFQPRQTVLSEESNVNESGVEGKFPGAEVSIGRNGQTGGGTNAQIISAQEGGDDRSQRPGESSDRFEGAIGGQEQRIKEALTSNPGGNTATEARKEPVPPTQAQQLEVDQEGTARQYAFNS